MHTTFIIAIVMAATCFDDVKSSHRQAVFIIYVKGELYTCSLQYNYKKLMYGILALHTVHINITHRKHF